VNGLPFTNHPKPFTACPVFYQGSPPALCSIRVHRSLFTKKESNGQNQRLQTARQQPAAAVLVEKTASQVTFRTG